MMGFDAGDFWTSIEIDKLAAERAIGRVALGQRPPVGGGIPS
jgi:hypothetical protein